MPSPLTANFPSGRERPVLADPKVCGTEVSQDKRFPINVLFEGNDAAAPGRGRSIKPPPFQIIYDADNVVLRVVVTDVTRKRREKPRGNGGFDPTLIADAGATNQVASITTALRRYRRQTAYLNNTNNRDSELTSGPALYRRRDLSGLTLSSKAPIL